MLSLTESYLQPPGDYFHGKATRVTQKTKAQRTQRRRQQRPKKTTQNNTHPDAVEHGVFRGRESSVQLHRSRLRPRLRAPELERYRLALRGHGADKKGRQRGRRGENLKRSTVRKSQRARHKKPPQRWGKQVFLNDTQSKVTLKFTFHLVLFVG